MTEKIKILLLEDDANLGSVLKEHLEMQGFSVHLCVNGEEGTTAFKANRYDLCLVDVMMPRKDGFTFARELRQTNDQMPLIFLTAKSLRQDRIEGFRIGCDDYITKPFSIEELLLRIKAVLKRTMGGSDETAVRTLFNIGQYKFDSNRQLLRYQEEETKLTSREAQLLKLLCLNMNQTLDRETALSKIWEETSYFAGRSMDVFVSRLRKHLRHDAKVEILGIHGKGFRLVVEDINESNKS